MMPGSPGPSLIRSPLRHVSTFGTPAARDSRACSDRCSASPCTGMRRCGRPADHVAQLVAAGIAGDMYQMGAVGDDLDALRHQAVDDRTHRLLVAGNGAGGEDNG